MPDFFELYKNHILLGFGISNLLLAFFLSVISYQIYAKKISQLKLHLSAALYLIAVAFSNFFDGSRTAAGFWILRIANFLVFSSLLLNALFLCEYITALFMASGKYKKLPKPLLAGFMIPCIGLTFVIITQFTGFYYYFDEFNVYHRGSLYWLSFTLPFGDLFILLSFVILNRTVINKRLVLSIIIFITILMVSGIVQVFIIRFPFIGFGSWIASVVLFTLSLSNQNQELSKAARTEISTGLPNTYGFVHEVDKIIHSRDITEYAGFYFDIVRMNTINSKYGRAVGDEIIVRYSHLLRGMMDKDEILSRLGGNFFTALVKKCNIQKFINVLKDTPVEIKINGEKNTVNISAVAGIYEINKKDIAAGQIIGATANAIGYAKNVVHKPYVFLDETLEKLLYRNTVMEEMTRKALHNKEFEAFYQPKVDSRTNELCGAEALSRWRRDGKLVPPLEFIPIMERNTSICDLDFCILEKVCCDIKEWLSRGIEPVKISVNFSRKNLGNPILAEAISKTVEKYDIPKKYIQVEITETIDEFPMSYLVGVVEALQRYGIDVAIDDFGTGSSSINMLKAVKFNVLKIDKSFIDYSNDMEKRLLENIIHMAQDIGIDVLAEGVENKSQILELSKMNCFIIQGYVYDKPLEKSEFEKRLNSKKYWK